MEVEFRLVQCTVVNFKLIIKIEIAIFLSFRKKRETKSFRAKFKNFVGVVVSLSKMCRSKMFLT